MLVLAHKFPINTGKFHVAQETLSIPYHKNYSKQASKTSYTKHD